LNGCFCHKQTFKQPQELLIEWLKTARRGMADLGDGKLQILANADVSDLADNINESLTQGHQSRS